MSQLIDFSKFISNGADIEVDPDDSAADDIDDSAADDIDGGDD